MELNMKRFRLVIVMMIMSAFMTAALSSCSKGGQSTDISGTFESGGTVYVFAEDGTASVTENGTTRYGFYKADGAQIRLMLDGEDRTFDYTFEGDELSLFSPGSIFGVSYSRTADASGTIEGWIEPQTLPHETEKSISAETENTAAETTPAQTGTAPASAETAPEQTSDAEPEAQTSAQASVETVTETAAETTAETTTAETVPETTADTFINLVSGNVTEGGIVTFGSYEQDNDLTNGAEPIEWIVLKVDGEKALMVSRYALDCQPFNTDGGYVTWEWCSLRYWLNDTFYNTAFDQDERNTIQTTYVPAEPNPDYAGVDAGNGTDDKVFLLSTNQAYIYFQMNQRKCVSTAYALAQGGGYDADFDGSWGWLRTPGNGNDRAACTDAEGKMYYAGVPVGDTATVLRPAICVRFR